jgi:hypothetical protein
MHARDAIVTMLGPLPSALGCRLGAHMKSSFTRDSLALKVWSFTGRVSLGNGYHVLLTPLHFEDDHFQPVTPRLNVTAPFSDSYTPRMYLGAGG